MAVCLHCPVVKGRSRCQPVVQPGHMGTRSRWGGFAGFLSDSVSIPCRFPCGNPGSRLGTGVTRGLFVWIMTAKPEIPPSVVDNGRCRLWRVTSSRPVCERPRMAPSRNASRGRDFDRVRKVDCLWGLLGVPGRESSVGDAADVEWMVRVDHGVASVQELAAARIIAKMPVRMASGSVGQASMIACRSGSKCAGFDSSATAFAPGLAETAVFPGK